MAYQVHLNSQAIDVEIVERRPVLRVNIGGTAYDVADAECPPSGPFAVVIDGVVRRGWRYATVDEVYIRLDGATYIVGMPQLGAGSGAAGQSDNDVRADMPGTVVAVHCAEGEVITAGQKLVTVESMKLQISLVAPRDGTVAKIHVAVNAPFERGAVLVSLAPRSKE